MSRHYDGQRTECQLCHKPIVWYPDANGKPKPYDPTGKSHFVTCTEWRRICKERDEARRAAKDALQGRLF